MEKKLATFILSGDVEGFAKCYHPVFKPADEVIFDGEDFSYTDFDPFETGFFVFRNCILDHAILQGVPLTMHRCSAQGLDIRGMELGLTAEKCDFRGMLYDEDSVLSTLDEWAVPSKFIACAFDKKAADHFRGQGVIFKRCNYIDESGNWTWDEDED